MSASTLARWNAIPLSPPEYTNLKRPRPDQDDGDDDISITSRTPSPPPNDAMDVDGDGLYKYDEYVRGTPREVITVETKIKPTNKGFAMLANLGWSEGQPLGLSGDGRVDPIPFQIKRDLTGLGKTSQDVRMIETTVSQRRELDSERQQKETEDQRRAREDLVARKTALETEISTTLKAFYCSLCDKQFKNVAQYDEHTNSYAHHHKARFNDMQANARPKDKGEVDKRKEKERKREEKELRKIAAANGIRMPKPAVKPTVSGDIDMGSTTPVVKSNLAEPDMSSGSAPSAGGPSPPQSGFKKSGWSTVGSPAPPTSAPPPDPPRASGRSPVPPGTHPAWPQAAHPSAAPAFRTAGWTSLDTGSVPQPPASSRTQSSPNTATGDRRPSTRAAVPDSLPLAPQPPASVSTPQPVRSGWQQFQKSGPRRK